VAEVIIDIPHGDVDRVFDYSIPQELQEKIQPGSRVKVPFGHGLRNGFVWKVKEKTNIQKLKAISNLVNESLLNPTQLKLVDWLVKNYFCFYITALQAVIPPEIAREEVPKESRVYPLPGEGPINWGRAGKQKKIWEHLNSLSYPPLKADLERELSTSSSTINTLEKKGLIKVKKEIMKIDPLSPRPKKGKNFESEREYSIEEKFISPGKFLLRFGPGENLWPFYCSLIKKTLEKKKGIILLVPEASQADFIGKMLVNLFPGETILLHSELSSKERYDQWWRSKNNRPVVLVGTRSAIFSPVQDLGLIIIHNEENEAFRQQENPRYITSEVAEKRIEIEGGSLLLSSSSPSVNAFYLKKNKNYSYLESPFLIENEKPIELVDMREEFEKGNISIFSESVKTVLKDLKKGTSKTIFFYVNRRGYAPFILCRSCGYVARCEKCNRTMTLHKTSNALQCHYCKTQQEPLETCPKCQSKFIRSLGIGTEKVAEEIKKYFPRLKYMIVDSDRIKTQDQLEKVSREIKEQKWDVIIGTRLLFKEFFPRFDFGVMVMADTNLNLPFYDSQEEFFHLVISNASRVREGKLFIQTYYPEQKTLQFASKNDWDKFMENEWEFRKKYSYPPAKQLLSFSLSGKLEKEVAQGAKKLAKEISSLACKGELDMMGPVSVSFFQEKGKFRWQVFCRAGKREMLGSVVNQTNGLVRELIRKGIVVNLELNPKGML